MELRNKITHSEFDCSPEYAAVKFAEVFSLVGYLQARHLHVEIEALIDREAFESLIKQEKNFAALRQKAFQRIEKEEIESTFVWICPECEEETFVAESEIDTCYLCRYNEPVTYCTHCDDLLFAYELEDISDLFDYDDQYLHNDYGYKDHRACSSCKSKIKDEIANQRMEDYHHMREEEEYHRQMLAADESAPNF